MFNPVIIVAIVFQVIIGKFSRIAGAITGYIITTGILIWGISVYREGYQMAFFGITLPSNVFLLGCGFWFWMDTREFKAAIKQSKEILPENFICPKCGKEVNLSQKEKNEKNFICPECNEIIYVDKEPIKELLPKEIICKKCGEELILNNRERTERKFICPECNKLIDYNNDESSYYKVTSDEEK